MKELDLYRFLHENNVEVHIFRNERDEEDMSELNDENYHEWKVYTLMAPYYIKDFTDMCPSSIFDDEGIECVLKDGYISFDLMEIMDYCDIDPSRIFKKN